MASVVHPTTVAELLVFQGFRFGSASPAVNGAPERMDAAWDGHSVPGVDLWGHAILHGPAYDIGPFEPPFPLAAPVAFAKHQTSPPRRPKLRHTAVRTDLAYEVLASGSLGGWSATPVAAPTRKTIG